MHQEGEKCLWGSMEGGQSTVWYLNGASWKEYYVSRIVKELQQELKGHVVKNITSDMIYTLLQVYNEFQSEVSVLLGEKQIEFEKISDNRATDQYIIKQVKWSILELNNKDIFPACSLDAKKHKQSVDKMIAYVSYQHGQELYHSMVRWHLIVEEIAQSICSVTKIYNKNLMNPYNIKVVQWEKQTMKLVVTDLCSHMGAFVKGIHNIQSGKYYNQLRPIFKKKRQIRK